MDGPKNRDNLILERIVRESGMPNLLTYLTRMPPKDLQSLLLRVFQERVSTPTTRELLGIYQKRYRYLGISELDQRELLCFDSLFYSMVPNEFEAIELSPVGPLGTNAALTKVSQHNILSTIRNAEVVSDPVAMLALEAALRRETLIKNDPKSTERVRLCTSKRLLRLQPFDASLGYMQHFRCIGMCTAGRGVGYERFLIETALEHIRIYLDFIEVLNREGFLIRDVTVHFSDIRIMEQLIAYAGVEREVIMRNTQNPDFKPFEKYSIQLPSFIEECTLNPQVIARYHIERSWELLTKLEQIVVRSLQETYPWALFGFDLARTAGIGYYPDFCFHIYGTNEKGLILQLADGGLTDWIKKLLHSNKELLMTTGFGAELVHKMFRRTTAP